MNDSIITRVYLNINIEIKTIIQLDAADHHHLTRVLRGKVGDKISIFNCREGEFIAEIIDIKKHNTLIQPIALLRDQVNDILPIELIFAVVKPNPMQSIIEKSIELGVKTITPIYTDRTVVKNINEDKLQLYMKNAIEQCGGLTSTKLNSVSHFTDIINQWPSKDKKLIFCDESLNSETKSNFAYNGENIAIIIGPEGGFSLREHNILNDKEFVIPVSLGKRILRADTAVVTAINYVRYNTN